MSINSGTINGTTESAAYTYDNLRETCHFESNK